MKGGLISVDVNEAQVKQLLHEKIEALVKEVDAEYVFWDSAELQRRTCMSWNFIQDNFFFDPRFTKRKVRSKWYFPARETRKFLETWLMEQPER
ncbi:group-specific protein [Paenibacillus thiaminolyticus]|uniref:group-specific protein n=1 Tax=Paenibacillus thiaminolyticus TaxID=49283 RepID=UPI0011650902|nr:group-specific protein [Paenibacillus thiaminolyticus]NGP56811.1 group-specific protein [Paenibacillus thiaminolyticus]